MFGKSQISLKIFFVITSIAFVSGLPLRAWTQQKLTPELYNCLELIYQGEYEAASKIYNSLPPSEKQIRDILEIFSLRWEFVPIQFSEKSNIYVKKLTEVNSLLRSTLNKDPVNQFLYASTELFLAEYHFALHNSWQALWHGKRVYPILSQSIDENKNDAEYYFMQGLYMYYIDYYSKKGFFYRSTLSLFKRGNKELGLKLLTIVANRMSIVQTEARIYLAHIYLHFENKPTEALPFAHNLFEKYPKNLKIRELYIETLFAAGLYSEGYDLLEKQLKVENAYYKIPALFLLGSFYLDYKDDKSTAKLIFNQCRELMKNNPTIQMEKKKMEKLMIRN
jgi:tetratricopeptide (TPR) repeat protein